MPIIYLCAILNNTLLVSKYATEFLLHKVRMYDIIIQVCFFIPIIHVPGKT